MVLPKLQALWSRSKEIFPLKLLSMFWRTKGGLVVCSQRMGLCGFLVICTIGYVTLVDALITPHSKALPANFFDMLLSFLPFATAGAYLFRDASITNSRTCFVIAFSSSALTFTIASVDQSIKVFIKSETTFHRPRNRPWQNNPNPPQSNPYKSLHLSLDRVYLSPVSKFTLLLRPLLLEK